MLVQKMFFTEDNLENLGASYLLKNTVILSCLSQYNGLLY